MRNRVVRWAASLLIALAFAIGLLANGGSVPVVRADEPTPTPTPCMTCGGNPGGHGGGG